MLQSIFKPTDYKQHFSNKNKKDQRLGYDAINNKLLMDIFWRVNLDAIYSFCRRLSISFWTINFNFYVFLYAISFAWFQVNLLYLIYQTKKNIKHLWILWNIRRTKLYLWSKNCWFSAEEWRENEIDNHWTVKTNVRIWFYIVLYFSLQRTSSSSSRISIYIYSMKTEEKD